jgi:hypothetical protein
VLLTIISDVSFESRVTLRVYEKHTFVGPCVGVMEYDISSVKDQLETTLGESGMRSFIPIHLAHYPGSHAECDTRKFTATITFPPPELVSHPGYKYASILMGWMKE